MRQPLYRCIILAHERAMQLWTLRRFNFNPLRRGIRIRVEDGLLYVEPNPAQHR